MYSTFLTQVYRITPADYLVGVHIPRMCTLVISEVTPKEHIHMIEANCFGYNWTGALSSIIQSIEGHEMTTGHMQTFAFILCAIV